MEATERDTDRTDRTDPRSRRTTWTVLAALASVAAVLAATWSTTRVGDKVVATLVALVGTGVAVALVAVVGRRSGQARTVRTIVLSTLVLGLVVVALSWNGTFVAAKAARSEASWQAAVDRVLTTGAERGAAPDPSVAAVPCVFGPQIAPDLRELEGFGRVDQICASSTPGHRFVSFSQYDGESWSSRWTGLVYSPDVDDPQVMSTCVAHLDGPWWQTASANPNCPPGYEFVGGG